MSALEVLRWSLLAEAVVLFVALALVLGHVAWHVAADGRRSRRLDGAREAFAEALADGAAAPAVAGALRGLPVRDTVAVLAAYAPVLGGSGRGVLSRAAADAGVTARAERDTRSRRWTRRLRGAQVLSTVGGGADAMPRLLDDPRAEVRAQAAGWAAREPGEAVSRRLVAHLDDPELVSRFSVQDALLRSGRTALPALRDALDHAEGPSAARLLEVCAPSGDSMFGPAALRLLHDPHPPTRALAADLAGRTAGADAMDEIAGLLDDPDPGVRASAASALGRAQHWPAGPRLRVLLRDAEWDVRRAAALALEGFGPAGGLLLRRALEDENPDARDMARLVLGRPAGV
ncbi:HEAT repeat domain-containing protein [Patulibacter americanus]|uniref:HEAT repeat domain-containing protein n=1 Tax=Patulibacter americanus TaxID=588672 RepID=UPI0004246FAD|nr:HEAT repeat domain-containing protein [Patulibacter americanus]